MIEKIIKKAKKEMDYLNNIKFSFKGEKFVPTEYDWINCYVVYNLMASKNKPQGIINPTNDFLKVFLISTAALTAYELDLTDYSTDLLNSLEPGDYVKVQGRLCKYLGVEKPTSVTECIIIKYSDMKLYLPIDQAWKIRKYSGNAQRLNKYEKTNKKEYDDRNTLGKIFEISKKDQAIVPKTKVVIVDQKKYVLSLFDKLKINDVPFTKLFSTAYFTDKNSFERIGRDSLQRNPIICFTSRMSVARNIIKKEPSKIGIFLADLSNKSTIPFGDLDLILKKGINTFLLLDTDKINDAYVFDSMGIKIRKWDSNSLNQLKIPKKTKPEDNHSMRVHKKMLNNIVNHEREIKVINPGDDFIENREKILETLTKVEEGCYDSPKTSEFLALSYYILFYLQNILCPVSFLKETEILQETTYEKIEKLKEKKSLIMGKIKSIDIIDYIKNVPELLNELMIHMDSGNSKYKVLEKRLNNIKGETGILVRKNNDKLITFKWLSKNFDLQNTEILTPKELNGYQTFKYLIFSGWFSELKGNPLYPGKGEKYIHLVYNFEKEFLTKHLKYQKEYFNRIPTIFSFFDNNTSKINKPSKDFKRKSNRRDITNIISDLNTSVTKLNNIDLNYGDIDRSKIEMARIVEFHEDYYAYITDEYRAHIINRDENKIQTVNGQDLKENDELVFSLHTKGNIFEEMVERVEKNNSKVRELKQLSELWQKVLREYINKNNISEESFAELLKKHGYSRVPETIRNWLNEDELIAPQDYQIIDVIAKITNDKKLKKQTNEVKRACKYIRKLHTRLGKFLVKRIIGSVFLENKENIKEENSEFSSVLNDLSEYAMILKINEITSEKIEVPRTKVNELLEKY